jgi:hypothetical protein
MIQLPRRSVTRFFIPLIDVLTLLFCIFLVMPLAQSGEEASAEQLKVKETELERLRNEGADTRALQEELDRLRKQLRLADRFPPTRVLEINGKTGRLFYRDPEEIEIRNITDAQELVKRDRKELSLGPGELYYLILYPRDRGSEHPLNAELDEYSRWFEGVKLKFDIPGQGLIQGSRP